MKRPNLWFYVAWIGAFLILKVLSSVFESHEWNMPLLFAGIVVLAIGGVGMKQSRSKSTDGNKAS
jgi:hypothetical protein